ncbi:right-handed parallel beta-helix repeat-containing protein [Bacillus sp. OVS6]|nr:right-handed parallel beta-helix repeat-containing protein [Bacillus sp. OVS6]
MNAAKFKISFRSKIQDIIESTITIRADGISQFVNISNCHIHDCRTLGIVGGGQFITIENCEISGIGGAAPGFGIDLEDGYNLNQNVIVRNNHFHDNKNGDIVTVSSRNVLLEMNKFNGTVSFGGGRGENYVSQYNEYNGTTGMGNSLAGGDGTFAVFRYDHMTGAQVFLSGNAIYENVVFDDTSFVLQSDQFLTSKFRNCSFNFNKPDTGWSWIIRRGSLYFDRCKFNIVSCQFYYIRDETFANSINTNLTMKNCEIIASSPFGGCSVNNLTLVGNIFKGTYDVNYQYFNFAAKNALISDNIIDSVNLVLNGTVGSTSSINIRNNLITINKAKYNSGPDRNEGIYLKKFDTIYFKYNQLIFQTSITVLAKGLTIYSEKIIELIDNSFLSSNSGNIIELNGAYRTAEDTTPIPKLVAILKGNYYSSNVQELKQTSFYNQLEKNYWR